MGAVKSAKKKVRRAHPSALGNHWRAVKDTASEWVDDKASRLAAALAFYALLALAPLLVIAISVAGWFWGPEAARGRVVGELGAIIGAEASGGIQSVVASARSPSGGVVATIVGIITLLIGASGLFSELQSSMNTIWEVEAKPGRGIWGEVKDRFLSFTMVLGVTFLLLVSLVISAALSALGDVVTGHLPGGNAVWSAVNFAFSYAVITGLFALLFKYVPDTEVQWRDVWIGAAVTAALFTFGKFLLGLYLGKVAVGSAYGAAGSLIALVVWVYYAAQIFFLGAEYTQVRARMYGEGIRPDKDAIAAPEAEHDAERPRESSAIRKLG
jgi:membrane protein